jgi:hypothetical protein
LQLKAHPLRLSPIVGAVVIAACGGGPPAPAPKSGCFTGDATAAPVITLVYQTPAGALMPVEDGSAAPLVVPPQGGEVLVVGVRALNLDGCPLTISSSLVVPGSGVIASFERRPVTLQPASDGWLEPKDPTGLANFANLPACPIVGLGQMIDGESFRLDVEVEDLAGRQASASATVVPTCDTAADPAGCACLCAADYVLGSACP